MRLFKRYGGVRLLTPLLLAASVGGGLAGCGSTNDGRGTVVRLADGTWFEAIPAERQAVHAALMAQHTEWRGTPYRLGGNTRQGIDCSAFVQITLRDHFRVSVPRTTEYQAQMGVAVPRSDIQIGDLVFFRTGRNTRHVGFYVGQGRFLHASTSVGVTINGLDEPYWRNAFWQVRRLL